MPNYDYKCEECEAVFEANHASGERPTFPCPRCESEETKKIFTGLNFSVASQKGMSDRQKRETDMRTELREDYMVHGATPVAAQSFEEVYKDVKANGSKVKEQMLQTIEQNQKKVDTKQKKWREDVQPRAKQKIEKIKKEKAKKATQKRAVMPK